MGLREKVALVMIAVVMFQTPYTNCKPKSVDENPFERYVGNKRHGKIIRNANYIKRHTSFNGPGETTINPATHKSNLPLGTAHASLNKNYDPVLLESFKKEARRKRKSKKHVYENIALTPSQLSDTRSPILVTDGGSFPEVEYPLSAIDTWMPKYWNALPYNSDDSFLKYNDYLSPTSTNIYKKKTNIKVKKKDKGETKSSKLIALPDFKTIIAKDISQMSPIAYSPDRQINRKHNKLMKTPGFISNLNNKKIISKSFDSHLQPRTVFSVASAESNITSTKSNKNFNSSIITDTVDTSYQNINTITSNTNNNGGAENNVVSYIQSSLNTDNGYNSTQTKLVSDECPSDVICNTQVQSIVSDTSSNYTHEALLSSLNVPETETSNNSKIYQDSMHITQLDDDTVLIQKPSRSEIDNGESMLPKDKLKTQEPLTLISPGLSNVSASPKLKEKSSSQAIDLAEKVLEKIGPLPKEYELPTDFELPQFFSGKSLPSENIPDLLKEMYSWNESNTLADLNKIYILVDNVLDKINSQQDGFSIPNDPLLEIISRIDSLPTNYTIHDQIPDLVEIIPAEYVISNPASKSYNRSEKIRQKTNINDKSPNTDESSSLIIPDNSSRNLISDKNNNNNSLSFCPLPTMDQCSIHEQPGAEILFNNTTSISNLMAILTGRTFENTSKYIEPIERVGVYNTLNQAAINLLGNDTEPRATGDGPHHNTLTDKSKSDKLLYIEIISSPKVSTNRISSTLPDQDVILFEPFTQDKSTLFDAQNLLKTLTFAAKLLNNGASIANSSDYSTDIIVDGVDQNTVPVTEVFPENKISNTEPPVPVLTENIPTTDYEIFKEDFNAQGEPIANNASILVTDVEKYDENGEDSSTESIAAPDFGTSPEILAFENTNISALLTAEIQRESSSNEKISELPDFEVLPVLITDDSSVNTPASLDAYKALPETFASMELLAFPYVHDLSESLATGPTQDIPDDDITIIFDYDISTNAPFAISDHNDVTTNTSSDSKALTGTKIFPGALTTDFKHAILMTDVEKFNENREDSSTESIAASDVGTSPEILSFEDTNSSALLEAEIQREPFSSENISELPDSEVLPVLIPFNVIPVRLDNDVTVISKTNVSTDNAPFANSDHNNVKTGTSSKALTETEIFPAIFTTDDIQIQRASLAKGEKLIQTKLYASMEEIPADSILESFE